LLLKYYQEYGPKDRLQLIVGDLMNRNDLDRAIETSDAVVSCLGAPRTVSAGANEFYEKTAKAIVSSMIRNGTRRLVIVTAAQARRMSSTWWDGDASLTENSARHLYWGGHYKHIAELEKIVKDHNKDLDYTFLRPASLDDESTSLACVSQQDTFFVQGPPLPRPALANFIVQDCIVEKKYISQGVALAGLGA
jgi:putative NADH-flavin reductase